MNRCFLHLSAYAYLLGAMGLPRSTHAAEGELDAAAPLTPNAESGDTKSGDTKPAPDSTAPLPVAVPGPLLLVVEGDFDDEARASLKNALVTELGCLVLGPDDDRAFSFRGSIQVRSDEAQGTLSIRFENEAHEVNERTVDVPPTAEDRQRVIVFVVGSLARSPVEPAPSAEGPRVASADSTAASALPSPPSSPKEPPLERQFAHASLYYPLATNYRKPDIHTHLGFNLVYGRVGHLEGLSFGTYQVATKRVQGMEFALAANVTPGQAEGGQVALAANVAGNAIGFQAALGANVARDVEGVQAALGVNVASDVDGVQAALGVNVASDVDGVQVGLVNHAKKVRGVQVGLVNLSSDVDGVPIGLVNVSKEGGVHPMLWYSNHSYVNAGVKFATRYTYTFVNLSWNTDDYLIGPGFGFGGSVPVWNKRLFVDLDLSETFLLPESGAQSGHVIDSSQFLSRLRALVRYQFLPHLGVFAGGGLAVKVERGYSEATGQPGDFGATSLGELSAGVQF